MASVLYYLILLIFTVVYFIIIVIVFLLTVLFDKERVVLHHASRVWALSIFRLGPRWKIEIEGREKIDNSKPWVVVTNHQSMGDIPLMYTVPLNFKWVSKTEVKKWPLFGVVLYMHGDILIKRGSSGSTRHMITQSVEHFKRGTSVIIFPEGTRTKTGRIGRFKEGAFLLAKTAGVGIQPVVLEGTGNVINGWKVRSPHTFKVHILDPIPAEEVVATDIRDMTEKVAAIMTEEHKKMTEGIY